MLQIGNTERVVTCNRACARSLQIGHSWKVDIALWWLSEPTTWIDRSHSYDCPRRRAKLWCNVSLKRTSLYCSGVSALPTFDGRFLQNHKQRWEHDQWADFLAQLIEVVVLKKHFPMTILMESCIYAEQIAHAFSVYLYRLASRSTLGQEFAF